MKDEDLDLDYFMEEVVIVGSPQTVTEKLIKLREDVGNFGNIVLVAHDWDDRLKWIRSLELFTHQVLPAINNFILKNKETI